MNPLTYHPLLQKQIDKLPAKQLEGKAIGNLLATISHNFSTFEKEKKIFENSLKVVKQECQEVTINAEEALKTKSVFLANMSHEIRTPLNGIVGMIDMLFETPITTEQLRYLSIIKSSSEILLGLINDILDFSKIEAGKMKLSSNPFELDNEITKCLQTLGLKASEKHLEFIYKHAEDLPNCFIGDAFRLQQIIINLVSNAIKFTEKGEIIVNIELKTINKHKATIHFSVSDTGIGIPQGELPFIFDEFKQVDGSNTRKYGGTGLGLSISKQLVEMMGGSIWVESVAGKGSKFHFTIQLEIDAGKPGFVTASKLKDTPVLIVEDNESAALYTQKLLIRFGMKPVVVASGEAAIAEIEKGVRLQKPYPIVLLDISLEGEMNGFTVAEAIRKNEKGNKTNIIVTSMSQKADDRRRFLKLGITEFYSKPFSPSDLLDSIQNSIHCNKPTAQRKKIPVLSLKNNNVKSVAASKKLNILLAEDNLVNQEVTAGMLIKHRHHVTIAQNGKVAVRTFSCNPFDLILMDVQMPEMNGYEATQRIRQMETVIGAHIPIIGLTANTLNGDREKCLESGMDAYLSKPVRLKDLLEVVSEIGKLKFAQTTKDRSSPNIGIHFEDLMEKFGDSAHLSKCLCMFNTELKCSLNKIESEIKQRNHKVILDKCHDLRGMLLTMEMQTAAYIVMKIEALVREDNLELINNLLLSVRQEITRSVNFLQTKIAC